MKIMIFGRPGGGKSTSANQLSKELGLPIYHLDKYFYVENWVERNYQEFLVYTWSFDQPVKERVEFLQAKYPHVKFYKIQSDKQLLELRKQLHDSN